MARFVFYQQEVALSVMISRGLTIVMANVAIVVWIRIALRYTQWRWMALIPLSYAVHVLVFYMAVLFLFCSPVCLNLWSSGIRLQGLILLILLAGYIVRTECYG